MKQPVLSLAHLTVLDAHPLELVDAALAGSFNAIGLRIIAPKPGDPLVPVIGDEALIVELLAKLAANGLSVLDVETLWIGPYLDVAALRPALEVTQRLGSTKLLVMGDDPDEARFTATFGRLCEEAAKYDVGVGLEFAAYTQVSTIQQAHRVVRNAGQSNGAVLIDALHMMRSGATPADIALLDASQLAYCQIADARGPRPDSNDGLRREARGGRFYPGEGELPLFALLDALPVGLPISVEAPCAEYAHLPVAERGRLAGLAAHKFVDAYGRHVAAR